MVRLACIAAALQLAGCTDAQKDVAQDPEMAPLRHGWVDEQEMATLEDNSGLWPSYGRTYSEQRFSPSSKINAANVSRLGLSWYFDLDTSRGQEATPLIVDGVIYLSTAWSMVKAIDARTGDLIWSYDPEVPRKTLVKACCDAVNRGVALWKGRVYVGSLDGRLIALDAKDGSVAWSVRTTDAVKPYTITGAPRVVKGRVIIGNSGAEYGVRGYISAYDAESGELDWRFYTTPSADGKPEGAASDSTLAMTYPTWSKGGVWRETGGGGTVWDAMAYDPELDLLYVGTGNGGPWNREIRSPGGGDNLFISSILALRPDTGEYVWHYQTTPGDSWDYTATQHIILADLEMNGAVRKVLMQAPKNGFFYVLDRETGEFLSAEPFAPINWASHIDANGRPVENPMARYPETGKEWIAMPGPPGAHNWNPMAFNPETGLVYIPQQEVGFVYTPEADFEIRDRGFNLGVIHPHLPENAALVSQIGKTLKGALIAWDPVFQKEVWRHQYPGPGNGGVLTTAGNLVFQGAAGGELHAFAADTGELLWSAPAGTGVIAPPISYELDGEQYIAWLVGWGGAFPLAAGEMSFLSGKVVNASRLLVFKLGGEKELPESPSFPEPAIVSHNVTPVLAQAKAGERKYTQYCGMCHGDSAVSGGVIADLRASGAIADEEVWKSIVLDGALSGLGMVSFASELSEEDAEEIRAYVLSRAAISIDRNEGQPAQ